MNGPTSYQLAILMALSRKAEGQVFQGVDKHPSLIERRAARRRSYREQVARRSATARRSR